MLKCLVSAFSTENVQHKANRRNRADKNSQPSVIICTAPYLTVLYERCCTLVLAAANVSFGGCWRSNLSVCHRETWRSQCLDFTPEWALSGSDSPMELQWTHKDSLFATVTARPHKREGEKHTLGKMGLDVEAVIKSHNETRAVCRC